MRDLRVEHATAVGAALARSAATLAHLPDPRAEARALLAALTGLPHSRLIAFPETLLDPRQSQRLAEWVARRADGEPLAYLCGRRGFGPLVLSVTPAVLVPRPETELLVELALARLPAAQVDAHPPCLDLGTGSGAIALACASTLPDIHWLATDRCPRALAVAKANADRLGIDNVRFLASNWWQAFARVRFGLVASNPPYLAAGEPALAGDGLRHEPEGALIGGADGLADLTRIIAGAPAHLVPGGWLLLEHGAAQGPAVREALAREGFAEIATHADLAGLPRVTLGCHAAGAEGG